MVGLSIANATSVQLCGIGLTAQISVLSGLGLLAFASEQTVGAVFSLSVVGLYIAYSIPIAVRFIFEDDQKPGPFRLGGRVSRTLMC